MARNMRTSDKYQRTALGLTFLPLILAAAVSIFFKEYTQVIFIIAIAMMLFLAVFLPLILPIKEARKREDQQIIDAITQLDDEHFRALMLWYFGVPPSNMRRHFSGEMTSDPAQLVFNAKSIVIQHLGERHDEQRLLDLLGELPRSG